MLGVSKPRGGGCLSRDLRFESLLVDLSGKRPASSGGHHYLMMILDDFSRFGWTYLLKEKSDVPAVFAGFLADIRAKGTPSTVECLRSDNRTGFTEGDLVTLLDHHRTRREYTQVDSPKYDGVVERRIALILEAAMASCLEAPRLFGGVPLPPTGPLWAEACVNASDAINVSARVSDKPDMLSPHQKLYGRAPFPRLLPFLKPGFHQVKRAQSEPKTQACFFLNSGSNHPRDCCKVLLVSGRRSRTRDVTWEHPREAFDGLLPSAWGRDTPSPAPGLSEAQMPPEDGEVWYRPALVPLGRHRGRHSRHRYRQGRHRCRRSRNIYRQERHRFRHSHHRCRQERHRGRKIRHRFRQ